MSDNSVVNWPRPMRWLHWLTLLMVILAWRLAESGEHDEAWMAWHHTTGALILLMILLRLIARWRLALPAPPPGLPGKLAGLTHLGLLTVLVLQALTGAFSVWLEGDAIVLFGQSLVSPLTLVSETQAERLEFWHEDVLWTTFVALLVAHAGAAVFHHWVLKDQVLMRMLGRGRH